MAKQPSGGTVIVLSRMAFVFRDGWPYGFDALGGGSRSVCAGVQAEIDFYLFLGVRFSPLLVVKVRQRNVRLRVFVVEAHGCQLFLHGSVELTLLLQHVAQVVVCRRKLRIEAESFPQVGFRFLRVAHKLLRHGEIQIRPRARDARTAGPVRWRG